MSIETIRVRDDDGTHRIDRAELRGIVVDHLIANRGETCVFLDGLLPDIFVDGKTREDIEATLDQALGMIQA